MFSESLAKGVIATKIVFRLAVLRLVSLKALHDLCTWGRLNKHSDEPKLTASSKDL